MGLLAVQGIGLEPFFATRNPVGSWGGYYAVPSWHQVGNDGLASQWGQCLVIRFVPRAGNDGARNARWTRRSTIRAQILIGPRNRAGIESGARIDRSRQTVRQRHVKHVVSHLSGRIAGAAGIVEQGDIEAPQAWFIG